MPLELPFVVRDPVHGLMAFTELERQLIDLPIFQRLRGLKQSSLAHLTYPSALTTRFEHSLGATHVAGRIVSHLQRDFPHDFEGLLRQTLSLYEADDSMESWNGIVHQGVRLAALFHDLGHLPFSHCFEKVLAEMLYEPDFASRWGEDAAAIWNDPARQARASAQAFHEFLGSLLAERHPDIRRVVERDRRSAMAHQLALDILDSGRSTPASHASIQGALGAVVHGEIDADRIDFVRRDTGMAGSSLGSFDSDRLIHSIALTMEGDAYIVRPSIRGQSAIETFLLARLSTYRWQYHHHNVVYHDLLLRLLVQSLLRDKDSQLLVDLRLENFMQLGGHHARSDWILLDDTLVMSHLMTYRGEMMRFYGPLDEAGSRTLAMIDEVLLRRKRRLALWKDHSGYLAFADLFKRAMQRQLEAVAGGAASDAAYALDQVWPTAGQGLDRVVGRMKSEDRLPAFQSWLWQRGSAWMIVDTKEVQLFRRHGGLSEMKLLSRPDDSRKWRLLSEVSTVLRGFGDHRGKELRFFAFELLPEAKAFCTREERRAMTADARERLAGALAEWVCSNPANLPLDDAKALGLAVTD